MEKHIKKIQILKVIHPGNFLVKILTNEDAVTFSMFVREMNSCLNELQSIGITSYRPAEKDICAALGDDGVWYRVRLTSRVTDHSFMCSKIDDISEFLCNSHRLMTLPRKFLEYPQQVLKCCLWDVHPITMTMELGDKGYQAKQRACEEWDQAATHFMIDQISNSIGCLAEIMKEDSDSVLHLKLYFITTDEEIYFNQKLLEEGYAISLPDLPPLISESAETQQPLDRYQKLLNRNNSSSGQRDNCERVVMDTFRTFGNSPESSIKCTSTPRKFDISPQLPGSVRIQSLLDIGSPPALVRCELSPQHKVSVNGHFSTEKQVAGKGRGLASIFSEKTLDSPSYGQSRSTFVARPVSPQQQFDKGLNFLSEEESFITSNGHDKRDLLASDHDRSLLNSSHAELQFDTKHFLQSSVSSSSSGEKSLTNIHSSSMSHQRSNFAPKLTSSEMQFGDRCTLNSSEKSSSLSNDQSVINLKVSDPNYCKSWVESSPIPESPSLDQTQRLQACSPSSSSSSSYLLSTTYTQYKSQGARPKQPKSSSNRLLEMLVKKHNGNDQTPLLNSSCEREDLLKGILETGPQTVRQDQPISRPFLGVVAHGIGLVPMAIDLADSHFHEDVKKVM
ncbi:ATP-dependent RNA helicase TDRD12 [Biomphalaria pfeifferi]|uniref:ATP-dependent RNA helicase TDRD12 n=1 Tax=Biomphalaria pfeifferi TaxID=112525 RepID=A0AAD8EW57_BIOPF|nr:ATP-dependent RNA helicase TDRD12 [Biomphalaria pfeifferi]